MLTAIRTMKQSKGVYATALYLREAGWPLEIALILLVKGR